MRSALPGEDVGVGRDQALPDDPAGALRADVARRPLDLDDGPRGALRARALKDARIRRREALLDPREERERVEAVERLEDGVGGNGAEQPGQERRLADLGTEPQRGLVEREDGDEPAEREPDQAAEEDPAEAVGDRERGPRVEEPANRASERAGEHAEQRGADEGAEQPGDGEPCRVLVEEVRGDDRPDDRTQGQAAEREGLRGEATLGAEDREGDDPEQEENVGDVHADKGTDPV